MADNFSKWQGGQNFYYAQQWGVGRTNDGAGKKKYGNAGHRRRVRFNPNPTRCNHPGCQIALQSQRDREAYQNKAKN